MQISHLARLGAWLAALSFSMLLTMTAQAQQALELGSEPTPISFSEGWSGFTDLAFLLSATLTLMLSAILGAIIGYHPRTMALADSLAEIEAPKVYITCAVIGAIIGILVVKYGLVVGFVIFGIGGLMRFRTLLGSANLTGNVILVTLIGLSCGLNLPHVAVLATLFSFILTFILDARLTYCISVKGVEPAQMLDSAAAYRKLLERYQCKIISERKKLNKQTLTLIFRSKGQLDREALELSLETEVPEALRGAIDWQVE